MKIDDPKGNFELYTEKPLYYYVLDYIKSRNFETHLSKYHDQIGTIHCGDPYILLANALIELRKIEQVLERARKSTNEKRKELMKEYADFEQKEIGFRQNFLRFDQFIRDNKEKRVRGVKKIAEDNFWAEKRLKDTEVIRESYNKFMDVKKKLESEIYKHNIYEKFLFKACEDSIFKQPNDMIEKYEQLLDTRNILSSKQEADLISLENSTSNLSKLTEAKTLIIIGLNTKMFGLEARYENSRYRSLVNENLIMDIYERASERIKELSVTKENIKNMYDDIMKSKIQFKDPNREDYENQLLYIKTTLGQLIKMNKALKKKIKLDTGDP